LIEFNIKLLFEEVNSYTNFGKKAFFTRFQHGIFSAGISKPRILGSEKLFLALHKLGVCLCKKSVWDGLPRQHSRREWQGWPQQQRVMPTHGPDIVLTWITTPSQI
jgi:hypothetical protein